MTSVGGARVLKCAALLVVFAFFAAVPAWCTISACPSNPTTSNLSPYLGSGDGCSTVNATFSDFAFTDPTGQMINGFTIGANVVDTCVSGSNGCPPGATGTYLTNSLTFPGSIIFTSPGPSTTNNTADTNFCTSNSGSGGWCLSNNSKETQYEAQQFSFTLNSNDPTSVIGLDVTAVSHSSSSGGAGGIALVLEEICPGSATVTSFSQGCTGYQVIQAGSVNGNFNKTAVSVSANFANPDTVYYIRDTVLLQTTQSNGDFSAITGFDVIITPEPSTLGMVGMALGGLGLLIRRRRRRLV